MQEQKNYHASITALQLDALSKKNVLLKKNTPFSCLKCGVAIRRFWFANIS